MPNLTPEAEAALNHAVTKAAGMPRARVIHADPQALPTVEQQPLPQPLCDQKVEQKSPAEWAYDRLILYIANFEKQLNPDQEVAMGIAGSEAGVLTIEGIGYFEPDIITFYGRDESGLKTQLIQHVSQLSVMLRAVPKAEPQEPARRIGFRLTSGWQGGEAGDASA